MIYDWEKKIEKRIAKGKDLPDGFQVAGILVANTDTAEGAVIGLRAPYSDSAIGNSDVLVDMLGDLTNAYGKWVFRLFDPPESEDPGD